MRADRGVTELKPFQQEGVEMIYAFRGRALLADDMGLGKTIQALAWIRKIPRRRPVIIITPAGVKYTWEAEALLHFNLRVSVLDGNRRGQTELPADIVVLNYDILKSWLPLLRSAKPQCLILDEAHYIRNPKARRTRLVLRLAKRMKSVVALSGTPLLNRPIELWTILKAVRPDLFPDHEAFAWRYCKPRHTRWGWVFDGAEHLGELHRILRRECMIRRLKKDVLTELPDKTRRAVIIKLKPKAYSEYLRAQDDFLVWLKSISPARAQRAKKGQALTKIGYLLRLVARLKLEWTELWIKEFFESNPGKKLVCFSMHTFVLDHLKERFDRRAVIIDGRVRGRKREEAVRQFQHNRKVDLLLGNWLAAGVGITLHASHVAAALDHPWTPGDLLQGEDRLHRIGQKQKVIINYLVAANTIEEKQIKVLRRKASILDDVLNGTRSSKDLDLFRELLAELRRSNR